MRSDIHGSSDTECYRVCLIYTRCTLEGTTNFQNFKIRITLALLQEAQWMAARAVATIEDLEVMSSVIVLGIWGFRNVKEVQTAVKTN